MKESCIDIVIPSYRLKENYLLGLINLQRPVDFEVAVYIIADNPDAQVPAAIKKLNDSGEIHLIINKQNLGAAGTRNVGMLAGQGKWILFLDDDIRPESNLLLTYAGAIRKNKDAIGFAGVTYFPLPFNTATLALTINGTIGSFTEAERKPDVPWAPTANVMLNRAKVDQGLFDTHLVNSEDMDFLTRNSLLFKERYISLPEAIAHHHWWDDGKPQTARVMSYGAGASQLLRKDPISRYTFRDFTNTIETSLLLLLLLPLALWIGKPLWVACFFIAMLLAEFFTSWLKGILIGKTYSIGVAWQLMYAKNAYEISYLFTSLKQGLIGNFALRIDMGFNKPHPSPFRTNRWKIIKMLLLAVLFLVAVITL